MFCPKCKAEYREGFTHCSDCDVDLVYSLPDEQNIPQEENEIKSQQVSDPGIDRDGLTFIPLLSTYNLGDIAMLRSILDGQGIEFYLQGENASYIRGYMDPTILMVREDQVQTVKELLGKFDLQFTMFSTKQ
jgi:hypothetical protein